MSWGTCYAGSNNIHFDFPPIMNDGRNFAHWIPSAEVSELIRKDAGIKHNHEYRTYLVNNVITLSKIANYSMRPMLQLPAEIWHR